MFDGVSILGMSGENLTDYAMAAVGAVSSFGLCSQAAGKYWKKYNDWKLNELKDARVFTWDPGGRMTTKVYLVWRAATVLFLIYIVASLVLHVHYLFTPRKCFGAVSNMALSGIEILDGLLLLLGFVLFVIHIFGDLRESWTLFIDRIKRMWKRVSERAGAGQIASGLVSMALGPVFAIGVAAAPPVLAVGSNFVATYPTQKASVTEAVTSRVTCACAKTVPATVIAQPPSATASPPPTQVAEAPSPAPVTAPSAPQSNVHHVMFDFDSATISPGAKAELESIKAGALPEQKADVVGHSDTYGTAAHNLALSKRRAETTKEALEHLGIEVNSVTWTGENNLPVPTTDGVKEPENRQATVTIGHIYKCTDGDSCPAFKSCEEAEYHFKVCGQTRLDGDHDGVPCEKLCKKPTS